MKVPPVTIYVFDVTNEASLTKTVDMIKIHRRDFYFQGYLVGNKIDLPRKISKEKGQSCAQELGLQYFELSATDHTSVQHLFKRIVYPKKVLHAEGLLVAKLIKNKPRTTNL